ncbi:MAG: serine/threonine-protein kinase [Candidatus Xenobia bacterium]
MQNRLVARRYRLERILGEGGMGTVYRAIDTELDAIVAVKFLKDRNLHPRSTRRFIREGRTGGRLCHPHIVKILDDGQDEGHPFLVMEYVDGVDIRRWYKHKRPIEALLSRCEEVLDALEYAHRHHIVHRDIKPENIFVNADGRVKVMDFGLAQDISGHQSASLTSTGSILGTAAYMSPEQAAARVTDHRTDLYSMGVVMYELLTGRLPFRGNPIQVLMDHLKKAPTPLHTHVPDINHDLEAFILCLLEKDVNARFQRARDALETLAAVRTSIQAGQRSPLLDEPWGTPVKPRPHGMFAEEEEDVIPSSESAIRIFQAQPEVKPAKSSGEVKTREMALVSFDVTQLEDCLKEISPLETLRVLEEYRTRVRQICGQGGASVVEFQRTLATVLFDAETMPQPGEAALQTALALAEDVKSWLGALAVRGTSRASVGASVFLEPVTTYSSVETTREASLEQTTQACRKIMGLALRESIVLANERAAEHAGSGIRASFMKQMFIGGRRNPVKLFSVSWNRPAAVG